jgi:hypothetical protein
MAKSPLPLRHMITIIKDGDLYRAWYRDTDKSYPTPCTPATRPITRVTQEQRRA